MTQFLVATALSLAALTGTTALAREGADYGGYTTAIKNGTSRVMPPAEHVGQWWTHPSGCQYSRAGRPGEVVWYLIINTERPECPSYIAIRGGRDVY
jgi:hypothetical protein